MKIPDTIEIGEIYLGKYYYNSKDIRFRPCKIVEIVDDDGLHNLPLSKDRAWYKVEWIIDPNIVNRNFCNRASLRVINVNWINNEITKRKRQIGELKIEIEDLESVYNKI